MGRTEGGSEPTGLISEHRRQLFHSVLKDKQIIKKVHSVRI